MGVRQHADVAELESVLLGGAKRRHLPCQLAAVAGEGDRDFAVRPRPHRHEELLPRVDPPARDVMTRSPRRMSALAAGESGSDHADDRRLILVDRDFSALVQHDRRQHHREGEVHHRAHDQDLESLPLRLRQELVGRDPCAAVFGRFAGHLDVAPERQRANAVFRVAAAEADDRGIEAELELQHPDADTLGGDEMTELVHEHQHAQHEHKCQKCGHSDCTTSDCQLRFYPAGELERIVACPAVDAAHFGKRRRPASADARPSSVQ